MIVPTATDLDTARRLARKYVYEGNEPYAPALMSFARMLAAHRVELEAARQAEAEVRRCACGRPLSARCAVCLHDLP